MSESLLLNILLWLPVLGGGLLLLLPEARAGLIRGWTLVILSLQFVLAVWLFIQFVPGVSELQFVTQVSWIPALGVQYYIALDGINLLLVLLTAFLGPLVVWGAARSITRELKLFHGMVLFLQFTMLGAFLAQDLFLFYLFWEAMLIPMFLIIGLWGGEQRVYATLKFFLYTAFGSILMLAAVIYLGYAMFSSTGTLSFAMADLQALDLGVNVQLWLLAAFALSFAIKVPMVPLHTWLPDAHVQAPTAGSVILAGVLLKMGTYGFMKLGFPFFPEAAVLAAPLFMALAVISIIYGAGLALVQNDIKKIIAYSSVSHLGYVMLGLVSFSLIGAQGAIVQMVSHGLIAGGLFLMVGMLYERYHSRDLAAYGGLAKTMPVFAVFFVLLTLAAMGLPTTSGFTGEFLVLLAAFQSAWPQYLLGDPWPLVMAAAAVLGIVLGAWYMLRLVRCLLFGSTQAPETPAPVLDLDGREKSILVILVAAILALGVAPQPFLQKTEAAAQVYSERLQQARTRLEEASP